MSELVAAVDTKVNELGVWIVGDFADTPFPAPWTYCCSDESMDGLCCLEANISTFKALVLGKQHCSVRAQGSCLIRVPIHGYCGGRG
jgi:hypothetical protein